jgi:hypothetical protein
MQFQLKLKLGDRSLELATHSGRVEPTWHIVDYANKTTLRVSL